MDHAGRLRSLQARIAQEGVDALWVTSLPNIRYLCGFRGSSGALLVWGSGARFFTDGRYTEAARAEVEQADVSIYAAQGELEAGVRDALSAAGAASAGFEADHMTVRQAERFASWLEGTEVSGCGAWTEDLRRVKDPEELSLMASAAEIGDAAFAFALERAAPGIAEADLALDIEVYLRTHGAEAVSFEPIVAAGESSALPHARPGPLAIAKGEFLLLDLGCRYQGYCSDLSRTVVVGPATEAQRRTYELVSAAQQAGLAAVRAGAPASEVDAAARSVMAEAGEGEAFVHSLGHGVGLEIHEAPTLRHGGEDVLAAGNAVTIEPGAYYPGWGGVRIEDLVVVTSLGWEALSKAPKDLISL